jgi:hypothetical protein
MFAAAIFAAAVLHTAAPPPAVQLATAQRAVSFHVMTEPSSMQLVRAEASHDGSQVRLEYSIEGAVVTIDERPVAPTDSPNNDAQAQLFNLNGYPAIYTEHGGYRGLSVLTWYRTDLTVAVYSRDRVNSPLLIDMALSLR